MWLIWSNAHNAWWRSNSAGYTDDVKQAGHYTKQEAERICKDGGKPRAWSTDPGPYEIMVPVPEGE